MHCQWVTQPSDVPTIGFHAQTDRVGSSFVSQSFRRTRLNSNVAANPLSSLKFSQSSRAGSEGPHVSVPLQTVPRLSEELLVGKLQYVELVKEVYIQQTRK